MNDMADMNEIAVKLMERTGETRIPWKSTVNPNSFSAVIGNLSVMISSQATRTNRTVIKLAIFDEKGAELEFLQHREGFSDGKELLVRLFQAAKRSAQGVDERLDELLTTLETGL